MVVLAGMSFGTWLSATGHELYGLASILAPLTAAAGLFVFNRRRQERERAVKHSRVARN
jgi:hypothetical protein